MTIAQTRTPLSLEKERNNMKITQQNYNSKQPNTVKEKKNLQLLQLFIKKIKITNIFQKQQANQKNGKKMKRIYQQNGKADSIKSSSEMIKAKLKCNNQHNDQRNFKRTEQHQAGIIKSKNPTSNHNAGLGFIPKSP